MIALRPQRELHAGSKDNVFEPRLDVCLKDIYPSSSLSSRATVFGSAWPFVARMT